MSLKSLLDGHGRNTLTFIDPENADRPITLQTYRPEGHTPDWPLVIVQHGMLRNGDNYRDFWIPAAERHHLLIVAPTFSHDFYPESEDYNNGRILDEDGNVRDSRGWGFGVPARVVEALWESDVIKQPKARIYGHSAGAQFVHRMISTQGGERFETAVAANAGWYSLPTLDKRFPEGLGGIGLGEAELVRLLAYPLQILAGLDDCAADAENLPTNPEAIAQGPGRLQRAHNYFALGRKAAAKLGVAFNWTLIEVPGIGHDGCAMSAAAAGFWFDGALPGLSDLTANANAINF